MDINGIVRQRTISGKDVFIFEDHAQALLPWAQIRRRFSRPLNLITLDHHTDTHQPFLRYRFERSKRSAYDHDEAAAAALLEPMLAEVDWRSDESVFTAITRLRNDEHICTATRTGILDWAFSINLDHSNTASREEDAWFESSLWNRPPRPRPPFTYDEPDSRVFKISSICAIDCRKGPHDDDCRPVHYAQVLESIYLTDQLRMAQGMFSSMGGGDLLAPESYILDVDLDYFHCDAAINPADPEMFYKLIRGAAGITIAREPWYVNDGRLPEQNLTADSLEVELLAHIERAMA